MEDKEEIKKLSEEFQASQKALIALGDEVREHLILVMMNSGSCSGLRVNDIAKKTNLSRPAVSHHRIARNGHLFDFPRKRFKAQG